MEKLLHFHCKALATHSVMESTFHISNTDWQSGHIYHLSELVYINLYTIQREFTMMMMMMMIMMLMKTIMFKILTEQHTPYHYFIHGDVFTLTVFVPTRYFNVICFLLGNSPAVSSNSRRLGTLYKFHLHRQWTSSTCL